MLPSVKQQKRRSFRRNTVVSAVAIAVGLGGVLKTYAQTQDQQVQQQQTPQTSASPQAPAAPSAGQPRLPQIVVTAPKTKPKPAAVARPAAPQPNPVAAAQAVLDAKMQKFDQARDSNLLPKTGASTYTISRDTIEK